MRLAGWRFPSALVVPHLPRLGTLCAGTRTLAGVCHFCLARPRAGARTGAPVKEKRIVVP